MPIGFCIKEFSFFLTKEIVESALFLDYIRTISVID